MPIRDPTTRATKQVDNAPATAVPTAIFQPRRHLLHAEEYRREMANRFSTCNEVTGLITAA
jgi:hypothetical protein